MREISPNAPPTTPRMTLKIMRSKERAAFFGAWFHFLRLFVGLRRLRFLNEDFLRRGIVSGLVAATEQPDQHRDLVLDDEFPGRARGYWENVLKNEPGCQRFDVLTPEEGQYHVLSWIRRLREGPIWS